MLGALLRERLFGSIRPSADEDLFDPVFFARLDRLRLSVARVTGARAGETPVRGLSQGSGIEIESFKSYTPGDDIRYLDWNVVARLDQLLTRRFVAEREIPVHLMIDASASMGAPAGDGKFAFAVRLAAALAYIALINNDPVRISAFRARSGNVLLEESPLYRHRGRYRQLKPFLAALAPDGQTALADGVARYLESHREAGIAFVVSDFLVPAEVYERSLGLLRSKRLQVQAIQVVGATERLARGLRGRLQLRDVETGGVRSVLFTDAERRRYQSAFAERLATIRSFCHGSGIGHAVALAEEGVERHLTRVLASEGMLRLR